MAKKKPNNKPSALLARALALFGPKGEGWITGSEHESIEAGFLVNNIHVAIEETDFLDDLQKLIFDKGLSIVDAAKKLAKEYQPCRAVEAYCAIGAIREVNTANEKKAAQYLAKAINKEYNFDEEDGDYEGVITGANDDLPDGPKGFKQVKKWFQKAIKLAQADNQ